MDKYTHEFYQDGNIIDNVDLIDPDFLYCFLIESHEKYKNQLLSIDKQ